MYVCKLLFKSKKEKNKTLAQARSWRGAWGGSAPPLGNKIEIMPPPGLTVGLENLTDFFDP